MENNNDKMLEGINSKKVGENMYLPISTNGEWFDVLIKNDVEQAKSMLSSLSQEDQHILLNSQFHFEEMEEIMANSSRIDSVFLPFHFAIASNAKNIARMMLKEYNVDVLCQDRNKCNVLHACVISAFFCHEIEEQLCETVKWLLETISEDQVQKLFAQEHRKGYRPIEFASQQGCLQLMKTFLESKGYVKKSKRYGAFERRYHDVTEYETGSRSLMSPINTLAYIDEEILNQQTCDLILNPLFMSWINAKIKSNIPMILMWAFLRYSMLAIYYILDNDVGWLFQFTNSTEQAEFFLCPELGYIDTSTSSHIRLILVLLLLAFFGLSLILDIAELIRNLFRKGNDFAMSISGKKSLVINTPYYMTNHFLLSLVICFNLSVYVYTYLNSTVPPNFELPVNLLRAIIPILILWSFNYFLQMLPMAGPSFISIQAMQVDVFKFLLMFIIIAVPFALAFQGFIMYNSMTGCVDDFSSIFDTAYTLFLVMLNDYDLSSIQVRNVLVLKLLHVTYVFMIGIMLLNFLIAMMSSKAAVIQSNQKVVFKLNQLALIHRLESRLKLFGGAGYCCLVKLGFHHCENGRVYLVSNRYRITDLLKDQLPST